MTSDLSKKPVIRDGWQDDAACKGFPVEVFFPIEQRRENFLYPKSICATCRVRDDCLTFALLNDFRIGVWGGTTWSERKHLRYRVGQWAMCRICGELFQRTKAKKYVCDECAERRREESKQRWRRQTR